MLACAILILSLHNLSASCRLSSAAAVYHCPKAGIQSRCCVCRLQVRADAYEKLDKELLELVEDVLLNRCDNATERILEYAATLDPKSKPTDVRKKGQVSPMLPLTAMFQ